VIGTDKFTASGKCGSMPDMNRRWHGSSAVAFPGTLRIEFWGINPEMSRAKRLRFKTTLRQWPRLIGQA
jgi:hypothetical protein